MEPKLHYGLPDGVEVPDFEKAERNHVVLYERWPDFVGTHLGKFVVCYDHGRRLEFGADPQDLLDRIPQEEVPTAALARVSRRDRALIL